MKSSKNKINVDYQLGVLLKVLIPAGCQSWFYLEYSRAESWHETVTLATQQCEAGVLRELSLSSLTLPATKQGKYIRYKKKRWCTNDYARQLIVWFERNLH